jgi:hypothetical protein
MATSDDGRSGTETTWAELHVCQPWATRRTSSYPVTTPVAVVLVAVRDGAPLTHGGQGLVEVEREIGSEVVEVVCAPVVGEGTAGRRAPVG